MMTWKSLGLLAIAFVIQAAPAPAPAGAKVWIGRAAEYEDYLRTAEIVKCDETAQGITHPKKCSLKPGGLVGFLAFKMIPPQIAQLPTGENVRENYKSEIAAYEIDKLIHLDMVPPTVEKKYKGETGAAIMWVAPSKSWAEMTGTTGQFGAPVKPAPTPPAQYLAAYTRMIAKAKMYGDLIGDPDPNYGNWLVDPDWNIILIDHSRALTGDTSLFQPLRYVDEDLWSTMKGLTIESLTPALQKWLSKGDIKAIITRRDKMQKQIDDLVKKYGADDVFMKK